MNAIPKALAMADPRLIAASAATVAGVIAGKFAINAVSDETDDTGGVGAAKEEGAASFPGGVPGVSELDDIEQDSLDISLDQAVLDYERMAKECLEAFKECGKSQRKC